MGGESLFRQIFDEAISYVCCNWRSRIVGDQLASGNYIKYLNIRDKFDNFRSLFDDLMRFVC